VSLRESARAKRGNVFAKDAEKLISQGFAEPNFYVFETKSDADGVNFFAKEKKFPKQFQNYLVGCHSLSNAHSQFIAHSLNENVTRHTLQPWTSRAQRSGDAEVAAK
jgi:hypothetical protein